MLMLAMMRSRKSERTVFIGNVNNQLWTLNVITFIFELDRSIGQGNQLNFFYKFSISRRVFPHSNDKMMRYSPENCRQGTRFPSEKFHHRISVHEMIFLTANIMEYALKFSKFFSWNVIKSLRCRYGWLEAYDFAD